MSRRRNADEELRRLERRAAQGDPLAVARLQAARLRATGIVPESHQISMAVTGVFTPTGAVLCLACDGRHPQAVAEAADATANARCDRCVVPVHLTRDDVGLLQNLRDELRVVQGVPSVLSQTGGMCVALAIPLGGVGGVVVLVAVEHECRTYVLDEGRIVADRGSDQPARHTYGHLGFPPGTQWTGVSTGMLEWFVGQDEQDGEELVFRPVTIRTKTVAEAAHLIARYVLAAATLHYGVDLRRHRPAPNPPHFLDTVESAIEWGLENVGDAESSHPLGDSELDREFRRRHRNEVSEYVAEFHKVMQAGKATIWRGLIVPQDVDPRKWIKWSGLGIYWSFRRSGASEYGGDAARREPERGLPMIDPDADVRLVVVKAIVDADDIDWEHGFESFWTYGTEQFECALEPGSKVRVVAIDERPVRRIAASANPDERRRILRREADRGDAAALEALRAIEERLTNAYVFSMQDVVREDGKIGSNRAVLLRCPRCGQTLRRKAQQVARGRTHCIHTPRPA